MVWFGLACFGLLCFALRHSAGNAHLSGSRLVFFKIIIQFSRGRQGKFNTCRARKQNERLIEFAFAGQLFIVSTAQVSDAFHRDPPLAGQPASMMNELAARVSAEPASWHGSIAFGSGANPWPELPAGR